MTERRSEPRIQLLNHTGKISIDEHRMFSCIVSDRSAAGVRVTLPDAEIVPDLFVLTIDETSEVLVCRARWRKVDEIGCLADTPENLRVVRSSLRKQPVPA